MADAGKELSAPNGFIAIMVIIGVILLLFLGGSVMVIFSGISKFLFSGTLGQKVPVWVAVLGIIGLVYALRTRRKYQPDQYY
jgi:energy-converting hydrogenase Eha subunit G